MPDFNRPALLTGSPVGALDPAYTPMQSPRYDAEDPFARAVDARQQSIIEAQNRLEEIKDNKWARIGRALSAGGAGLAGRNPQAVLQPHYARVDALHNQINQGRAGIEDLSLQRHLLEQKARMGANVADPSAVREYEYWKSLPPEERANYLKVRRDTMVSRGDQLYDVSSGTPVEMMSDEDLEAIYQRRIQSKRGEAEASKQGQDDAEQASLAEQNAKAYQAFSLGVGNLRTSLSNTVTGPGMGLVPAVTSEAQEAEGAGALMAPLLKNLFREAGEGTFTKDDQQILLDMLPDRNTFGPARDRKLYMVDSIVRIKLGAPQVSFEEWQRAQKGDILRDGPERAADASSNDPLGIRGNQ